MSSQLYLRGRLVLTYPGRIVQLECGMPASLPDLATSLATGNRHLPYEERLQRMGLYSLQRQ